MEASLAGFRLRPDTIHRVSVDLGNSHDAFLVRVGAPGVGEDQQAEIRVKRAGHREGGAGDTTSLRGHGNCLTSWLILAALSDLRPCRIDRGRDLTTRIVAGFMFEIDPRFVGPSQRLRGYRSRTRAARVTFRTDPKFELGAQTVLLK